MSAKMLQNLAGGKKKLKKQSSKQTKGKEGRKRVENRTRQGTWEACDKSQEHRGAESAEGKHRCPPSGSFGLVHIALRINIIILLA